MTATGLWPALALHALVLLAVWGIGVFLAGALLPGGRAYAAERIGWGLACGLALVAGGSAISQLLAVRPGIGSSLILLAVVFPIARRYHLGAPEDSVAREPWTPFSVVFAVVAVLGVGLFLLRALTEPMWSGDYLAIWGLKGKSLFLEGKLPDHLWRDPRFAFSHPEYPIGLPLLFAGVAGIAGRWDDHALALVSPLWLIATLAVLVGWLRRRGASRTVALAGAALIAHFQALYSAFHAGMAEIPAAFGFLLVGASLSDALDRTDRGVVRRAALASLVLAATKNEGAFFVGLAFLIASYDALRRRKAGEEAARRGWATPLALAVPVAASMLLHRLALGSHPVRDLDLRYLFQPDFFSRLAEGIAFIRKLHVAPSWLALLALLILILLGRRNPAADRLLFLVGALAAVYLVLPALCVYGPEWLATWAIGRTFVALAPLTAAAVALRLAKGVNRAISLKEPTV